MVAVRFPVLSWRNWYSPMLVSADLKQLAWRFPSHRILYQWFFFSSFASGSGASFLDRCLIFCVYDQRRHLVNSWRWSGPKWFQYNSSYHGLCFQKFQTIYLWNEVHCLGLNLSWLIRNSKMIKQCKAYWMINSAILMSSELAIFWFIPSMMEWWVIQFNTHNTLVRSWFV